MAMYTPNEFQTQLFDEIFSSTKGKRKITAELMEVLGCSRASLYRKRTGTTPLTTDELIRLADHFSLSIDALRKNAEENSLVVVCTTLPPIKGYDDIDFYLDNTRRNLNQAVNIPGAQLYFIAKEVPIYRYMDRPTLSAFRFYLWNHEHMRRNDRFDPSHAPSMLFEKGKELSQLSRQLKVTEFWTLSSFDNLINQIHYVKNRGLASDRLVAAMKKELEEVLAELVQDIKKEQTAQGQPYHMMLCEYLTINDGALLEITDHHSVALFSYSSINYLKSSNPNIVDAFKRGLRYHRMQGEVLDGLNKDGIHKFEEAIRAKISAL